MSDIEIAKIMQEIVKFCTDKWEPQYRLVKYCIEENSEGLNYTITVIDSVNKVLGL